MIFAREVSDNLTSLVKKIDAETVKNGKKNMGSFVVFLNDDEGLFDKLKKLIEKEGLKECILTIDNVQVPYSKILEWISLATSCHAPALAVQAGQTTAGLQGDMSRRAW